MGTEWTVIISHEVREWFNQQAQADQIVVRRARDAQAAYKHGRK